MADPPLLKSIPDFLLDAPLYEPFKLELGDILRLSGRVGPDGTMLAKFDGFCPFCGKDTTYELEHLPLSSVELNGVETMHAFRGASVTCPVTRATQSLSGCACVKWS